MAPAFIFVRSDYLLEVLCPTMSREMHQKISIALMDPYERMRSIHAQEHEEVLISSFIPLSIVSGLQN
jgi:hypothetical protein